MWLDGVSVNFYMDEAMFAALERWRDQREITNRTHAVRMMIAQTSSQPADPYEPGLLEYLDRWRNNEGTRTGAIRTIIERTLSLDEISAKPKVPQPRLKAVPAP